MTPAPSPTLPPASQAPPSELQQQELAAAQRLYRPIRRAGRTAQFSAVSTLIIASIAVVVVLFSPDLVGALSAVALLTIGFIEWVGYRRLIRCQPNAASLLMRNQLAFLGLIALYCIIQMAMFSSRNRSNQALSPSDRAQLMSTAPELVAGVDQDMQKLGPTIQYGFYSLVLVLSIAFQGGLALYYATRRKHLIAFRQGVAPWAQNLVLQANAPT